MRYSTALCLAIAAGCGNANDLAQSAAALIPKCAPGYEPVCSGDGPRSQVICDCECINYCGTTCTNLAGDTQNCGGCGVVCSSNHVTPLCSNGVCSGACATGYADCNHNKQTDGCEVATTTDVNNCGACGVVCGAGQYCSSGNCCNSGQTWCGSACVNELTDSANCGACGVTCAGWQVCKAGRCSPGPLLRTAVVLINAPGAPTHPYVNSAASIFFSSSNVLSARSFIDVTSFGLSEIVGGSGVEGTSSDVYGPYTVTNSCIGVSDAAGAALLASGTFNPASYDILVISVNDPTCDLGAPGSTTISGKLFPTAIISNGAFGDTAPTGGIGHETLHEFGHDLGLSHANGWDCFVPAVQSLAGQCSSLEYGDPTDTMGGELYGHYGPILKDQLGWLPAGTETTVTSTGTYVINAYEDGVQNTKVLKIPRKLDSTGRATGYYYVAFHQPAAHWTDWLSQSPQLGQGITISMDETFLTASRSQLLDMTPGSDFNDAALLPGNTFTDSANGISIGLPATGISGSTASVNVTLHARKNRFIQAGLAVLGQYGLPSGASVQGTGSFGGGSNVSLMAVVPPSYSFQSWTDGSGHVLSTASTYSITLTADQVVWANLAFAPPPNDVFSNATSVTTLPFQDTENTEAGTTDSMPASFLCYEPNGLSKTVSPVHTLWYKFTPATTQPLTVNTAGSKINTSIAVFTGGPSESMLALGLCSYDGADRPGEVTFMAIGGTTYYIQIGGEGAAGQVVVNFATPPPNDNFAWAQPITSVPYLSTVNTTNASYESGEPALLGCFFRAGPGKSVWYQFTAGSTTQTFTVDTTGSTYATPPVVEAFTGTTLQGLTMVSQYSCSPSYSFTTSPWTTYFIQISDNQNIGGNLVAYFSAQ
jgi:hypothetical protein